jgi:hypothetical protein
MPPFDRTDLKSVRRAFAAAAGCRFQQAWLPENEAAFCPGEVRLGWRENSLMVFAELTDRDIFNSATRLNQPAWELGDVFEMFFKLEKMERYFEFQVTPRNQRLQLSHARARAADWAGEPGEFARCLLWTESFFSRTWVEAEANRWLVHAEISAETVGGEGQSLADSRWRFSFGRYDYTRGAPAPVISSTAALSRPDFHRQQEWDKLTFVDSLVIMSR